MVTESYLEEAEILASKAKIVPFDVEKAVSEISLGRRSEILSGRRLLRLKKRRAS